MAASEISRDDTSGFAPTVSNELAVRQAYQLQTGLLRPDEEHVTDDSLTLTDIGRIILKHKWTLLVVIALTCFAAIVRTFLSTPIYRSTVILQIDRASPRVVRFENDPEQERLGSDDAIAMRTQQELLKSRSLAERVIDELRLDRSTPSGDKALELSATPAQAASAPAPESSDPGAQPADSEQTGDFLDRLVNGYRKMTSPSVDKAEVLGRDAVVRQFLNAVTVEPVRSSRLVKVHVDNTDPKLAARIANSTVQAFIAMGMERRLEGTSYAKSFLEDQIKQVKAKLEESERRLNAYAQTNQILTLDDKSNATIGLTYTDFATALAKAEQERIRAETVLAEVKRNPEASSAVVENKTIGAFKERRARLMIDYQENLRVFKPEYPKMLQLKAQIAEMDAQIQAEIANVVGSLAAARDAAVQQEQVLKARVNESLNQVLTKQGQSIDLNLLKREVDTNRQLYDNLLQRFKELGVSANIMSNNISVVDAAEPALFPYKPNFLVNLLIGLVAGVLLGAAIVVGLEVVDDSIKYPDEIERVLGLPLMGVIPKLNRKRGSNTPVAMEVHEDPRSTVAEAYRSVRTALQFSTPEGAPKRLVVTSTTRNEGKSTTSLALAINFAQMGQRVLLIDADMRNPTVHKFLGIPNDFGLSNLLSSDNRGDKMITPTVIPNLSVLTAGPIPPNPVDLLTGPKLLLLLNITAALGIDYVIVDAPPMLGLADAVVLGNQLQNVLYVVRSGTTRRAQIKSALRRLRQAGLVPRGAILTQALQSAMTQDYESYYGYGAEGAAPTAALTKAR